MSFLSAIRLENYFKKRIFIPCCLQRSLVHVKYSESMHMQRFLLSASVRNLGRHFPSMKLPSVPRYYDYDASMLPQLVGISSARWISDLF